MDAYKQSGCPGVVTLHPEYITDAEGHRKSVVLRLEEYEALMEIKPVRDEQAYREALREIAVLMETDPALGTPEGDRLDVLSTLVEAYEARTFPMDLPDPVEAILFRMEQQGLKPKDLEPMIGKRNRVYEVLNRKRPLTLAMIWRLHTALGIPAESLIREPKH